jgi:hypothetical protein
MSRWKVAGALHSPKGKTLVRSNHRLQSIRLSTSTNSWSWVLNIKELKNLLLNFMSILSITLPNLFIIDVPFPALLSNIIRSRFRVEHATLLIPILILVLWWKIFTVPGTKVAPFP